LTGEPQVARSRSQNIATLLTPFTAFLLAETIHASGVLAVVTCVVTCGLIMSQTGPRIGRADTRQQTTAFWTLVTYLLNGALFVLVGLEAQTTIRNLTSVALTVPNSAARTTPLTAEGHS